MPPPFVMASGCHAVRGMVNLFKTLEDAARRGADGLMPQAREGIRDALCALQGPEGGFAGQDGKEDPYYTFFAWLSLRALGVACDRDRLCAYMAMCRSDANPVHVSCARIVSTVEGREKRVSWTKLVAARLRGDVRDVYGAFLLMFAMGDAPSWLARLVWWRHRKTFEWGSGERSSTPRLAAELVLARLAGVGDMKIRRALEARRCADGGFASADNVTADLLATAVARFALGVGQKRESESGALLKRDLAFVASCWTDDGLFGASSAAGRGDAEHTFYGLLALGTCR